MLFAYDKYSWVKIMTFYRIHTFILSLFVITVHSRPYFRQIWQFMCRESDQKCLRTDFDQQLRREVELSMSVS